MHASPLWPSRLSTCEQEEVNPMKLTVSEKGVFLDGHEIPQCFQVDLKNISPVDGMEAVLHVDVSEADIQWAVKE